MVEQEKTQLLSLSFTSATLALFLDCAGWETALTQVLETPCWRQPSTLTVRHRLCSMQPTFAKKAQHIQFLSTQVWSFCNTPKCRYCWQFNPQFVNSSKPYLVAFCLIGKGEVRYWADVSLQSNLRRPEANGIQTRVNRLQSDGANHGTIVIKLNAWRNWG